MPRLRVEGLLATFPRLVTGNTQHTFVETENIRYVYHPIEGLYLVMLTNKHSNIIDDLDTLQLLSKAVVDVCGGSSEDAVMDHAFDLLFAFDEVLSHGGYKEDISLAQIRTNMVMDSHDERIAKLIEQSKINEAQEESRRRRKLMAKRAPGAEGFGGGGSGMDDMRSPLPTPAPTPAPAPAPAPVSKPMAGGMRLSAASGKSSLLSSVLAEDGIAIHTEAADAGRGGESKTAAAAEPLGDVDVRIEEKVSAKVNRDLTLQFLEVKGSLTVQTVNTSVPQARVAITKGDTSGFQFQLNPSVSKEAFQSESALQLKDVSRPMGAAPVGMIRWRLRTTDESKLPIIFNCWPEEVSSGVMNVNIEYTLQRKNFTLQNVTLTVPLPSGNPTIVRCDGKHEHNAMENTLTWKLAMVDASRPTGVLEFKIACSDDSVFFPLNVNYFCAQPLLPLTVNSVQILDDTGAVVGDCTHTVGVAQTVSSYVIADE